MAIPQMSLPIVGAPYANKDKSNRQFEIMLCEPGDPLTLVPEPKNKYDEHAIAVVSERGVQIGYVTSERAPYLGQLMRQGHELRAIFQAPTQWGCFARVAADEDPVLRTRPAPPPTGADPDSGFYPDEIYPDD